MPASGRLAFPCRPESIGTLSCFCSQTLVVNTRRQPGASPWHCSLGLPGFSSGHESLITSLLSGSTRCRLVLEIPDCAPGPAGSVNASCYGHGEPAPSLAARLLQFSLARAPLAGLGFLDNSRRLCGGSADPELLPNIPSVFVPSRSNTAK